MRSSLLLVLPVLLTACGARGHTDRRTLRAPPATTPDAVAVPPPRSVAGDAGPWHHRRGVFSADGPAARPNERWRRALGAPITLPLTTDGTYIYAVSGGTVHQLTRDGEVRWSAPARAVGPVAPLHGAPAVATEDGVVLLLDPDTGRHDAAYVASEPIGTAVPVGAELAWVESDGTVSSGSSWTYDTGEPGAASGGPVSAGEVLLYGTQSARLRAVTPAGLRWSVQLPGPAVGHPTTDASRVLVAYGAGQGHSGGVAAYALEDGRELWRWALSLEPAAPPALGRLVLVPDLGGQLNALDPDTGELVWRTPGESSWSATPAIGGMGAFATEIHGMVVRIDMDDGGLVWRADLRSAIASSPVLIGDTLVVGLVSGDVVALGPSPAD